MKPASPQLIALLASRQFWSADLCQIDLVKKEVEHSVRVAKVMLSHLTSRHPDLFQSKDVAWYVATGEEGPK